MADAEQALDLNVVRGELEELRDTIRRRLAVLAQRPELGASQGFGKRIGDGTTEAVKRLTDIGVGDSLERQLSRTERALSKLENGTYGVCDVCGEQISPGRMRALPDGVLCVRCAATERRIPRRR